MECLVKSIAVASDADPELSHFEQSHRLATEREPGGTLSQVNGTPRTCAHTCQQVSPRHLACRGVEGLKELVQMDRAPQS